MQPHRGFKCGLAALPRPDGFGKQRVQLPDVIRIAAREVVRDEIEPLGYGEVSQFLAALSALHPQHLAPLG